MELYPTPDSEVHRTSAKDVIQAVCAISSDMFLTEEQRLHHLHQMLELCAAEHEREVQEYQTAHRHLIEHEGEYSVMLTYPNVREKAFNEWESEVGRDMEEDRARMKHARANTEALLKATKHVEHQGQS